MRVTLRSTLGLRVHGIDAHPFVHREPEQGHRAAVRSHGREQVPTEPIAGLGVAPLSVRDRTPHDPPPGVRRTLIAQRAQVEPIPEPLEVT